MSTECNSAYLDFPTLGRREILADFDGGDISSDGGALLLRKVEQLTGILRQFAACSHDHRDPGRIEHTVGDLVAQRAYALAPGYEGLNDHDDPRRDPLLAAVVGELDPIGQTRRHRRDRGRAPAGKSTLNRLELTPVGADAESRSKEITRRTRDIERLPVTSLLRAPVAPPEHIVLDLAMPPTTRSTATGPDASSTATTGAIATCRSTSSAAIICSGPGFVPRTSTPAPGP